jgi:hypothetical protein
MNLKVSGINLKVSGVNLKVSGINLKVCRINSGAERGAGRGFRERSEGVMAATNV